MIKDFFNQLALFYHLENDLSNIVVALCNSDYLFREIFLRFFFPEIDISDVELILREVSDKTNLGSRVDILITLRNDSAPYLIEVKKGDRNHHFGQYEEAYCVGKERFGYITNYECTEGKKLGYDVKTWEEFYDLLILHHGEDRLIDAFAAYLKNICGIVKYEKPMNITGLESIPCFADTVRKIISSEKSWVETSFYREYVYSSSIHEGFMINFPGCSNSGFAVFGLWFQEVPVISICINSRPWLSEKIMTDKASFATKSKIFKMPYQQNFWDRNDVWFELSDQLLNDFISSGDYEGQQRILEEFFNEVVSSIKKYF